MRHRIGDHRLPAKVPGGNDFWNAEDGDRVEGTTREDNHAMRRVFDKTGYVQEAHYREARPAPIKPSPQ